MATKSRFTVYSDMDLQVFRGSQLSSMSSNYIVEKLISKGTFARVAKCVKTSTKEKVAVKMTKIESEEEKQDGTLQKLRAFDPDTWHFVKWDSSFIYKGHLCQEFELLDISLKDYINRRPNPSFSLKEIRHILFQVATTLQLLKNLGIAHTHLNPENIMLVDQVQQQLTVKVIGFGAACDVSKGEQGPCIQPKFYRAPETMLGLPCNEATDMWALGSIAVELLLGHVLYPGCSDYEMLWFITQTQGQLPGDMINAGLKTSQFYSMTWQNIWKFKTPEKYGSLPWIDCMFSSLDDLKQIQQMPWRLLSKADPKADQEDFVELVKQMLQLDPCQRITPSEMLGHPFFTVSHQVDFCCPQSPSSEQSEAVSESGSSSSRSSLRAQSPQDQWPVSEENTLVDTKSVKDSSEQKPDDQPIIRPSSPAQSLQDQLSVSEEDDSSLDHIEPLNKTKRTYDAILQKCNKDKESISPKRKKIEIHEGKSLRKRPYKDISKGTEKIPEISSPERKRIRLTPDAEQDNTKLPSTTNEGPSTVTQTVHKKRQWRALGSKSNLTTTEKSTSGNIRVPKIWIIGSSYIQRGRKAVTEKFGKNFGLPAIVEWFGKGGMGWKGVLPRFYAEISTQGPPDILVVHAGGNDLGLITAKELTAIIKKDLIKLHAEFPSMTIAYSCINERQVWRNGKPWKINNDRKTVNNHITWAAGGFSCKVIEHPLLRYYNKKLFLDDGVHFTKEGNGVFLGSIRNALKKILCIP